MTPTFPWPDVPKIFPEAIAMKIYLDDYREAPEGWTLYKNAEQFYGGIFNGMDERMKNGFTPHNWITHVSFDHDLHPEHYAIPQATWQRNPSPDGLVHPTGYDVCAAFIWFAKENSLPHVVLTCHSANTAGKANIEKLIHEYNQTFQ